MNRCRKCLVPDTRPDTYFNDEGVCSACINHAARPQIDWEIRRQKLIDILDKADGRVMVPSSGGKDSHYIALRLKELGADVTAVTASTCFLTPIGRANIDNLARHVRTIEISPNKTVRSTLNRLALEWVGDPSWPEHAAIHRVPFKIAREMGFNAVFYGECPNNEYGGPQGTEGTSIMSHRWASEFGGFLGLRPVDFVGVDGITERDMADYTAPDDFELNKSDVTAYFLGWFEPWDSHRNADRAVAAGMTAQLPAQSNWWPHENLDNAQTAIHDHMMYRKYGYGRAVAQLSVDIRQGRIARSVAHDIMRERDGILPDVYMGVSLNEILESMRMTRAAFNQALDKHTNWALFDRAARTLTVKNAGPMPELEYIEGETAKVISSGFV